MSTTPARRPHPNPTGLTVRDRIAKRGLAITLREMVSDEEIGEALVAIALEGRWPTRTTYSGQRGRPGHGKVEVHPAAQPLAAMSTTPDGAHRMMALKFLLERRNGMPMQGVLLKAEIDARTRAIDAAGDAIDLDALDTGAAELLEQALTKALGGARATRPVIDAESYERELEGEETSE